MAQRSLVLFAHGARDPRWAEPFQRLRQLTQELAPDATVSLAFLEWMEPSLPELVHRLVQDGCKDITVVPVFFGQGGHVLRDLPPMIGKLKQDYPEAAIKAVAAVGENADVLNAIARYCIGSLQPMP